MFVFYKSNFFLIFVFVFARSSFKSYKSNNLFFFAPTMKMWENEVSPLLLIFFSEKDLPFPPINPHHNIYNK